MADADADSVAKGKQTSGSQPCADSVAEGEQACGSQPHVAPATSQPAKTSASAEPAETSASAEPGDQLPETSASAGPTETSASAEASDQPTETSASAEAQGPSIGHSNALALCAKKGYEMAESKDVFGCLEDIRQRFEFSQDRCSRCFGGMRLFKGQLKSKTSKLLICDRCNRAATMLSRHVSWPPAEWSSLSDSDIVSFWQHCGEIQEGDKLEWKKLRVVLISSLTKAVLHEKRSQIAEEGSFLPLSRYAQQGFDPDVIQANTEEHNKMWHPVLQQTVYRLPIMAISYHDIHQQITSRITNLEATKKMRGSALRKGLGDQPSANALEDTSQSSSLKTAAQPISVVDSSSSSSSSSSDKKKKKKKKKSKKDKRSSGEGTAPDISPPAPTERELKMQQRKEEREKEKQRKQEVAQCRKHNSTVCALATRANPLLKKAVENAEKCLKDPQCSKIHAGSVEKLSKLYEEVKGWRDEASDVLSKAKSYSDKDRRLPELTFTKDLAAKTVIKLEETSCALQKMIAIVSSC